MKGRHVLWLTIISFAIGRVVLWFYSNWDVQGVSEKALVVFSIYCFISGAIRTYPNPDKKFSRITAFDMLIPLMWVAHPYIFINKLADKYLTVEEKEPNK